MTHTHTRAYLDIWPWQNSSGLPNVNELRDRAAGNASSTKEREVNADPSNMESWKERGHSLHSKLPAPQAAPIERPRAV